MSEIKINRKCLLCKKKIKKFAKWNDDVVRPIHRSCWLNFRDFGDRHYDFLFCGDRKNQKKTIVVEPKKDPEK
tara:strand:+ start:385 stop:603 length:219 start_codon:yes stop_codon:yes gene_type:complete